MGLARKPDSGLAAEILPRPLYRALTHVFSQGVEGMMLVGGTALAGYYAGHRRSDDLARKIHDSPAAPPDLPASAALRSVGLLNVLSSTPASPSLRPPCIHRHLRRFATGYRESSALDLFTDGPLAQRAAVLAVESLRELGTSLGQERSSAHFYHATCELEDHAFTAQVVLDPNLFAVGSAIEADDRVIVADLETLLKTKAATLVSRASEKDLYDLSWFFEQEGEIDMPTLLSLGWEVDAGMNGESLLISLVGARLDESACRFSRRESSPQVLARVTRVREGLIQGVESYLRDRPPPRIAELIDKLT